MARQRSRSAYTIYDHARGDGWILTAYGDKEKIPDGHRIELVLYYTDEERVETHTVRNTRHTHGVDSFFRGFLDIGAVLGYYESNQKPEPNTEFSEQPQGVRMQRHATDIYATLGEARGFSETMAVQAAEEFGSTWDEKGAEEWEERIPNVGATRSKAIAGVLNGD
jgi:hypothetical protein